MLNVATTDPIKIPDRSQTTRKEHPWPNLHSLIVSCLWNSKEFGSMLVGTLYCSCSSNLILTLRFLCQPSYVLWVCCLGAQALPDFILLHLQQFVLYQIQLAPLLHPQHIVEKKIIHFLYYLIPYYKIIVKFRKYLPDSTLPIF